MVWQRKNMKMTKNIGNSKDKSRMWQGFTDLEAEYGI